MTTLEAFAERLAERVQRPLFFAELEQLAQDRYGDVGPLPSAGNHEAAMRTIVAVLPRIREPFQLARAVLFAGRLVELGADASAAAREAAEHIAAFMHSAAQAVRPSPDEPDPMQLARAVATLHPDAASAILGVDAMVAGTMMLLCQDRESLRRARRHRDLIDDARIVGGTIITAHFLAELLASTDHMTMLVLDPQQRRGAIVDADGIRNGFQLFTLLEGVLLGPGGLLGGPGVPPDELAVARGALPLTEPTEFTARLDYFNWSAWGSSGWVSDAPARFIWGELPLVSIPVVAGTPVVLVAPPRYSRSWDARLSCAVHPEQRPNVVLERELPSSEVEQWLAGLLRAPESARAAMRYAGVALPPR
jgi:hypothetical protein